MEAQQGLGTSSNSDEFFRVRTLGLRDPQADQTEVAKALAAAFKIPEARALQLIRGSAVVAKRTGHDKALRLKKTLLKLGVHARVEKLTAATDDTPDRKAETGLKNFIATVNRSSAQVERSSTYRYWALAAASAAVVAPLLYLTMVLGVVLGLGAYVSWAPGPKNFITLLAYVTPIVIGLVVFVFLVRPFFTRYTDPPRIELSRQNAPGLFALARQVSICVGTPEPEAIYIDNQVNASVSPTDGLGSLVRRKLELTVGMPLVYGMDARELASVIAHEFGHFSQPVEMFSGAAVNTVNGWMARCAWYEDPWEARLGRWRELDWSVALVAQCALWSISGVRYLMRGLLALNTRITRRLSQEMEFNADDHAVHVIGTQAFVDSSNSIRELLAAQELAWQANMAGYSENKLMDNWSAAVRDVRAGFTDAKRNVIRAQMDEEETEYWHTHPADRERIDRAESWAVSDIDSGVFGSERLLRNHEKLAQQLTQQTYSRNGFTDARSLTSPNEQVFDIARARDDGAEALERVFPAWAQARIPNPDVKVGKGTAADANSSRFQEFDQHVDRSERLFLAAVYTDSGIELDAQAWALPVASAATIDRALTESDAAIDELERGFQRSDAIYFQRIRSARQGLSATEQERCDQLIELIRLLKAEEQCLRTIGRYANVVAVLAEYLEENEFEPFSKKLDLYRTYTRDEISKLAGRLATARNPLTSAAETETIGDFLRSWRFQAPDANADLIPGHLLELTANCVNALWFLVHRSLGELARLTVSADGESGADAAPGATSSGATDNPRDQAA